MLQEKWIVVTNPLPSSAWIPLGDIDQKHAKYVLKNKARQNYREWPGLGSWVYKRVYKVYKGNAGVLFRVDQSQVIFELDLSEVSKSWEQPGGNYPRKRNKNFTRSGTEWRPGH